MYRDIHHKTIWVDDQLKVPAMAPGKVLNICRDFLGKSIIVHLRDCPGQNSRLILIYAHTKPGPDIFPGKTVNRGDILGNIADTSTRKSKIPCHLHISVIEVPHTIENRYLNWDLFTAPAPVGIYHYNPWMIKLNGS